MGIHMNKQTRKPRIKTVFAALALLAITAAQASVAVSNLTVAQRPGTKLMDITYDVTSTMTNKVTISLVVNNGAATVSTPSVSGAVGVDLPTGLGKKITWDMGADWAASVASLSFSVSADDKVRGVLVPGGDPTAVSWKVVNARWVKNTYANGDITMSDRTNNKMWIYNGGLSGYATWSDAISRCENLTYAGYSDWVLPDKDTLNGQYSQQGYFFNMQYADCYWSSTSYATYNAWVVYMGDIYEDIYEKTWYGYVWPVRGGQ